MMGIAMARITLIYFQPNKQTKSLLPYFYKMHPYFIDTLARYAIGPLKTQRIKSTFFFSEYIHFEPVFFFFFFL